MSERNDELERLIDEGLQRYVAAEPRLGMENHVLAALEEQRQHRPGWRRPWLVAVPTAAVLAIVIGLSLQQKTQPQQPAAQRASSAPAVPSLGQVPPQVAVRAPERPARPRAAVQGSVRAPRLEKFPAPEPLSPQEVQLARLAQNRAAVQTVALREAGPTQDIVLSWITIDPIEIQFLPGPNPQGD